MSYHCFIPWGSYCYYADGSVCPYWEAVIVNQEELREEFIEGIFNPKVFTAKCTYLDFVDHQDGLLWDKVKCCEVNK